MIVYHPNFKIVLRDFGIDLPLADERAERIFSCAQELGLEVVADFNPLREADLLLAHSPAYVAELMGPGVQQVIEQAYELQAEEGPASRFNWRQQRRPFSELRDLHLWQGGGTFRGLELAREKGFAFCAGGGMHHAMKGRGRGFCLINDLVIGLRKLQTAGKIDRAWIIDVDAHKGDGSAEMVENDSSIDTLSIHMARGWPLDGEKFDRQGNPYPWFISSTLDIPIEEGEEENYVIKLEKGLMALGPRADIAVVVLGADAYEHDALESTRPLQLTLGMLKERERLVFQFLQSKKIPFCITMGGGYGPRSCEVYEQAIRVAIELGLFKAHGA